MPNDPDSQESGKLGRYWRCYCGKSSESGALLAGIMIPKRFFELTRQSIRTARISPAPAGPAFKSAKSL